MDHHDEPRVLTEHDIDHIAEKAAEKALEKVYTEIGKSVVKKALWVIGVAALVAMVWLSGSGKAPIIPK